MNYVNGVGRTSFGVLASSPKELMSEAINSALADAELEASDVGAVIVSSFLTGVEPRQLHLNSIVSGILGTNVPVIRVEGACASGGIALKQALLSLQEHDNVLAVGVEKMSSAASEKISSDIALAGHFELDYKEGLVFPAAYALIAQQHFLKHGSSIDDLSLISLKNHENANYNPLAHFYEKQVTLDKIESSPIVSSPLRLFDCSPISDGAAAVIVSKKKTSRSVSVLACEMASDTISLSERKDATSFKATKLSAKKAFEKAGLQRKQVKHVEVHDCFTIAELIALEDLGFYEAGAAAKAVRKEETKLNGALPVNTDGGLKADGHPIGASGLAQTFECVLQLRSEAGKRQVDCDYSLAQNIGGIGGTAVTTIFGATK
ncbi:thiolase domain-containing protein [Candidatus Micrarchaeota archaeon]|nr:thiolase domain-containing protein [Candidatus Micrarchaeota archaeon]